MDRRKMLLFRAAGLLMAAAALILMAVACSGQESLLQDGYYTAEAADFDKYGWKEYITIYVSGNKVQTVEYDAYNASGFSRSWDINYMRRMAAHCGTYPNEFRRIYGVSLLNWQSIEEVDAITGASESHRIFQILAGAAIEQSRTGNKQVVQVDLGEVGEPPKG